MQKVKDLNTLISDGYNPEEAAEIINRQAQEKEAEERGFQWPDIKPVTMAELTEEIPDRRFLLKDGDNGVLPRGVAGIFAAAGGVGKSWALLQLAVSIACGKRWLGRYHVPLEESGKVLLLAGEEEQEELMRRLQACMSTLNVLTGDKQRLTKNLHLMPLSGTNPVLTDDTTGKPSEIATSLFERMQEDDWSLIIIDPLTRFAGLGVETDNGLGTRFVSVVERLQKLPGRPTVLVAHHTNKADRGNQKKRTNEEEATGSRGSSSITDGSRWAATLRETPRPETWNGPPVYRFNIPKNNYCPYFVNPLLLHREPGNEGVLTPLSEDNEKAWFEAIEESKKKKSKRKGKETGKETVKDNPDDNPFENHDSNKLRASFDESESEGEC